MSSLWPGQFGGFLAQAAAVGNVAMLEDFDRRARQAAAVNDRGMVKLVGNDQIVFPEDGRYGARVGGKAGLEDHAGFRVLEASDLLFEFHVRAHGAGDGADRAGAGAVAPHGLDSGALERAVRGQSKIVVRAEVDDLLAVEIGDGLLLAGKHAQMEVAALGLQLFELIVQEGELRALGHEKPLKRGAETNSRFLVAALLGMTRAPNQRRATDGLDYLPGRAVGAKDDLAGQPSF